MFCFRGIGPYSRVCCEFQCCQWSILRPASVEKGRITSRAARQFCGKILTDFEQKGPRRGRILTKNCFLLLSPLILGKCPRNIVIFPLTQTKIVLFFSPNSLIREKYWVTEFFLQWTNFSSELAEKFCKELASLVKFNTQSRNP
jgi:hypothetical protein